MKHKLVVTLSIAALAIGAGAAFFQSRPMEVAGGPAIGRPAPQFTATDSMGKSHKLSDFKGKYVVLEWFNNGCPFVVKHYKPGNMQALQKEMTAKGVVWLTISSSAEGKQGYLTNETANNLRKEWTMNSTAILMDSAGTIGRMYGARTTPHMFVLDPNQNVIYMGAIDDKPSANSDDIAGARNHVREALREAMAGRRVSMPTSQPYGCSVKY